MNEIQYVPQSYFNTELYHHGVKGMKWGVRRYQPYSEGSYDPKTATLGEKLKRRHAMRKYKFTKHEPYKNSSVGRKIGRRAMYLGERTLMSKKKTRALEYKVDNEGADRKKEIGKAATKKVVKKAIKTAAVTAVGAAFVLKFNNYVVDTYGRAKGLRVVEGPHTLGIKQVKRGKEVAKRMLKIGKDYLFGK